MKLGGVMKKGSQKTVKKGLGKVGRNEEEKLAKIRSRNGGA